MQACLVLLSHKGCFHSWTFRVILPDLHGLYVSIERAGQKGQLSGTFSIAKLVSASRYVLEIAYKQC